MTCFEFNNKISDIVDGFLTEKEKQELESHLARCKDCSERISHYRILLTAISALPRLRASGNFLNTEDRAQESLSFSTEDLRSRTSRHPTYVNKLRSFWKRLPWYLRTTLEGTGIVFLVLLTVSTGPKLRSLYDRYIEKSVSEFKDEASVTDFTHGSQKDLPNMAKGNLGAPKTAGVEEEIELDESDSAGESTIEELPENIEKIKVSNSELWRFNLKTDSPKEIRNQIVQVLSSLRVPKDTPGLGGIEAPGGIQFDLLVPQNVIAPLKHHLQKMAPRIAENSAKRSAMDPFSWYKNRSKKPLPKGQTRIVIWISQI